MGYGLAYYWSTRYLESSFSIYGVTTFACMLHSTQLLFPLLTVKCWRMEAAGNSLAQSSSCKVGTLVRTTQLYIYISQDTHNVDTLFRLSAALSNTTHVVWDVWGNNGGLATACCCLLPGSCPWFLFAMSWPRADMLTCWFSRYPCRYPSIHSRYLQLALISARYLVLDSR